MKRFIQTIAALFFIASILFANPYIVLADEGDVGAHGLEVEVNCYRIILANQND